MTGQQPPHELDADPDPTQQLLEDGQEEVFSREELESGRIEHQSGAGNGKIQGDPGEANRGIGQEMVGEPGPGPTQRPAFAPAAGGPGNGAGETLGDPKHQRPMAEPTRDVTAKDEGRGLKTPADEPGGAAGPPGTGAN